VILLEARVEGAPWPRGGEDDVWPAPASSLGLDCQRQPKRLIALMCGRAGAAASTLAIARLAHQCPPPSGHGTNGGLWRLSAPSGSLALQKRRHSALAVDGV
jgi:hypothetical protein